MSELTMDTNFSTGTKPGHLRGWLEVLSIVLLMPIGGILGGLTGFAPMGAIMSVALPLFAATLYLRREGTSWRSLVVGTPSWVTFYLLLGLITFLTLLPVDNNHFQVFI